MPSHGYAASASVTIPPLGAVWLRLEAELDEEQEIEPEKAIRGVIAAARAASPQATIADEPVTGPTQPRRATPESTEEEASVTERPQSPDSPESPDSPDSPDSPASPSSPNSPRSG